MNWVSLAKDKGFRSVSEIIDQRLEQPMSDERRTQKRVPYLVDVQWEGATGRREARTCDLSSGGCFVDTVAQATVGEVINFRLCLPSGEWIDIEGEVTYVDESVGFGVRFINVTDDDQKKIEWLVKAEEYRRSGGQ